MNLELFISDPDPFFQIIPDLVPGPLQFLRNRTRKLMAETCGFMRIRTHNTPHGPRVFDQTALLRRNKDIMLIALPLS